MLQLHYKDFNKAFIGLNQYLYKDDRIEGIQPAKYMITDVRVDVDSIDCSKIDIAKLGYKKGKWSHLLSHYFDVDRFRKLQETMSGAKKDTITYQCDNSLGGGCIQSITFTRNNGKEPWNKVFIHWKVCQIETKWGMDLIYINKVINALPNVKLDQITLTFCKIFHNPLSIVFLIDTVFGCEFPKPNSKRPKDKRYLSLDKWRQEDSRYLNFSSFARTQKAYKIAKGWEKNDLGSIDPSILKLPI